MKQDFRTARAQEDGRQIPALDGLRGLAALWVFLSHVRILTGMTPVPTLLAYGELAVDLFMFVSGFLMAFHYLERREQEPWNAGRTWLRFWCRRFFRITPAYYVLLLISLLTGAYLGDARNAVAHVWPETATAASRYLDHGVWNVVTHVTYTFGLIPRYAFNTPLPDWSIGLEMQFYAVFPLLMLLIARYGALLVIATLAVAMFGVQIIAPGFFSSFPMPAFLPMKLYMFMTGMAAALTRGTPRASVGFLLAASLPAIEFALHPVAVSAARIAMVAVLFILFSAESMRFGALALPVVRILRRALGIRFGKVMGDLAYSFYLIHLLVLLPVAGFLTKFERYLNAPGAVRFIAVALIVGTITFGLSWLLHRAVEQPGIALGKRLLKRRIVMTGREGAISFRR
ncbi:acyltransferase [Caballeronia sp. LZ029]|uniref:acyltransferase family protein n=1 Tax=Caballeronia sp. LZ029 TaxID=3038564 RepID=UPI002865C8BD|nr:acyltransferase [Caballeronia sp. LZ029]MDR5744311.1 acyltransferase [Caballeronia sp. LZ029]